MSVQEIASIRANDQDWYQAAGGNVSCKNDESIHIKKSGFRVSEISKNEGYICLPLSELNNKVAQLLKLEISDGELEDRYNLLIKSFSDISRPSMETAFHLFSKKYVMHSHPTLVNILNCSLEGQRILEKEFSADALCAPYTKPGILISKKIVEMTKGKNIPSIIFLFNHGLILLGDTIKEIETLLQNIENRIAKYITPDLYPKNITMYSEGILYPDFAVYCNQSNKFHDEVFYHHNRLLSIIKNLNFTPSFLDQYEVDQVLGMEQEKFRLNMIKDIGL